MKALLLFMAAPVIFNDGLALSRSLVAPMLGWMVSVQGGDPKPGGIVVFKEVPDGGIVATGRDCTAFRDLSGSIYCKFRGALRKTNADGEILWERGIEDGVLIRSVEETDDGGFILGATVMRSTACSSCSGRALAL